MASAAQVGLATLPHRHPTRARSSPDLGQPLHPPSRACTGDAGAAQVTPSRTARRGHFLEPQEQVRRASRTPPPPACISPMTEPACNMHRACSFIMYVSWHACSAVMSAYPIPLSHHHRTSPHITSRSLAAVGPFGRCNLTIIAAAATTRSRPDRAGRGWRVLPHRPPQAWWEAPAAEALVDEKGTELAALDPPPAPTVPGAAAAAATAARAPAATPRAASRGSAGPPPGQRCNTCLEGRGGRGGALGLCFFVLQRSQRSHCT